MLIEYSVSSVTTTVASCDEKRCSFNVRYIATKFGHDMTQCTIESFNGLSI